MVSKIFVNLPVKDLKKSIGFFTELGFKFEPKFTDENATCMIIGENIFAMLLVEKFFRIFTPKEICDSGKFTEVITALQIDSRAAVDDLMAKARAAGATSPMPKQEMPVMYGDNFTDLDGHMWEVFYMEG